MEFEIITTPRGRKLRNRFIGKEKTSSWNYVFGHKIIDPKFNNNYVLNKLTDEVMPEFIKQPQVQELIKLYDK